MQKIISIIFIITLLTLAGCAQEGNTVNVQGNSELTVDPDNAEVSAGVSILKPTAEEAQSETNKAINNILTALKSEQISEEDIETQRLNLYEEKSWEDGKSISKGWRATQILKIKTTDLEKVGNIVDIAVSNGANQINNINFGLTEEKEQEYKKQALAEAGKNAKSKAETIAESLGLKLGKIKTVSESNYYQRPYTYALEKTVGAGAVAEAASILPSDVTVTATVSIVYHVR